MEEFVYHNIFETKGIEYIIIIFFLLILIPFWIIVNRLPKMGGQVLPENRVLNLDFLRIPQGVLFHSNHTWAHLEKKGIAKIGIDDFLIGIVGEVKVNQLRFPGEMVQKGEIISVMYQKGKKLNVTAPVSGKIVAVNRQLIENPGLLHDDPFESGWFYKVQPAHWKSETAGFFLAEEATSWIINELQRFKDFLAVSLSRNSDGFSMPVLQEGGEIRMHLLAEFSTEIWNEFQDEFLSSEEVFYDKM